MNSRNPNRFLSITTAIVLMAGIASLYSNCSEPGNTLSNQSGPTGFPLNALVWRPNRLVTFSCGADSQFNLAATNPSSYPYPTFWVWYETEQQHSNDRYPAGLYLSTDALKYLDANPMTPKQIFSNISHDLYPTFELIKDAADSTPSGWFFNYNSTGEIITNPNFHTATDTASGQSFDGNQAQLSLSQKLVAPNSVQLEMRTTHQALYDNSAMSLGLLFHAPGETRDYVNLVYNKDLGNGATSIHVAGEALKVFFSGRVVSTPAGSDPVAPFNGNGVDRDQIQSSGVAHNWICKNYLVTVPGDTNCLTSASTGPPDPGTFAKLRAMGSFGSWNTFNCFVPNKPDIANSCYYNNYDPIASVAAAAAANQPPPLWYQAGPGGAPSHTEVNTPHWLSVCWRSTNGGI